MFGRPAVTLTACLTLMGAVSACGGTGGDLDNRSADGRTSPSAATSPAKIGTAGPRVGDCFTHAYVKVPTADTTVPCTVKHTAEITRVITAPAGLNPAVKADQKRLDTISDARCPRAATYVGYRGILNSAVSTSHTSPVKESRTKGAHWMACTVVTYVSPPTQSGKYTLRERTTPIKDTLTTDKALLGEGTVCVPNQSGGETVACVAGKGQWVGLVYRPDVRPFVSAGHQGDYARSFCQAAADAYGKNRPPWQGFWSATATEGSGQNCLIALTNFNRSAAPVVLGRSQTKFMSPIESEFAAKLKTVGQRLSAEPALMSAEVQKQNLRSSPNYFPRAVQERTLCKVLACTGAFGVNTGTAGNTTTFTASAPFEGKSCTGSVVFPLGYLGAPFTVEKIRCE